MTALSTRDRLAVRFLTLCLPAGPVRTRYRREFRSELATMPPAEHAGYLLRLLSRMPLLAAEIDRPRRLVLESGTEFEPTLRCRLRLGHRWADAYTEDGHLPQVPQLRPRPAGRLQRPQRRGHARRADARVDVRPRLDPCCVAPGPRARGALV